MKQRTNLSLSPAAVAKGRQLAVESGKSLSAIIEQQLLAAPAGGGDAEEYWQGPALKPLHRRNDRRGVYLKRKHGA